MEFSFTLRFELKEGTGAQGIALRFTREANGAMAAVMDALADVKSAMPQARLLELSPAFNGHSVEATQVVAATLWLLTQPRQRPVTASLDCLGSPTEAVEEIRVPNRYLVGRPAPQVTMALAAKAGSIASHGEGSHPGW